MMFKMIYNPYEILGVSEEATLEEVEKRYQEINVAYRNVKDMIKSKELEAVGLPSEEEIKAREAKERAKEEERRKKEYEYYRVKRIYRNLTMLHEAITSQLASKKYKNNFLGRLDKVIMEYINLANQNKEYYFPRDEYISKMKSIEEQFKTLSLAQLDKINAEELTLEVQANKSYIEFYRLTTNDLKKNSITDWAIFMSHKIFKWLDLDDNIRDVYNIARAKFMSEYGVDEETMLKIDYTVHKNLANYVNELSFNYDETLEQIEKNVDVFLREAYTYYMTNIEDDNLKR